ncbi:hypothetical protein, partial [Pseudovibrio axinellae]|uniref:hypothetical protein n=1 Tax=Pseudovibrio axinellae TaxID=989403 RepID=UPI001AD8F48A
PSATREVAIVQSLCAVKLRSLRSAQAAFAGKAISGDNNGAGLALCSFQANRCSTDELVSASPAMNGLKLIWQPEVS